MHCGLAAGVRGVVGSGDPMRAQEPTPIPWKARLPWFQVWVPLALLLYVLVNGAGHMVCLYQASYGRADILDPLKSAQAYLWGHWAPLTFPCLGILALVSWKTCPYWSASVRWASRVLGLFLICIFLSVQAWLVQAPYGWPPKGGAWSYQKQTLAWIWLPHLSRPGMNISHKGYAELLEAPGGHIRYSALHALGPRGAKEFTSLFVKLLRDPEEQQVRNYAKISLYMIEPKGAAPDIAKLLEDPESDVRVSAAELLGRLDAKEYAPQIAKLLDDRDQDVRQMAAEVLRKLDQPAPLP